MIDVNMSVTYKSEIPIRHWIIDNFLNLYFAKKRPTIIRNGSIFLVDDDRFSLKKNEKILDFSSLISFSFCLLTSLF